MKCDACFQEIYKQNLENEKKIVTNEQDFIKELLSEIIDYREITKRVTELIDCENYKIAMFRLGYLKCNLDSKIKILEKVINDKQ